MAEIRVDNTASIGYRLTTTTTADTWPFDVYQNSTTSATTNIEPESGTTTAWYIWTGNGHMTRISADEARARQTLYAGPYRGESPEPSDEEITEEEAALARSKDLLYENLDEDQRTTFENLGYVPVEVNGKHFRINKRKNYSVREVDKNGNAVEFLCAVTNIEVPIYDQILALMLTLKYRYNDFMEMANHRPLLYG